MNGNRVRSASPIPSSIQKAEHASGAEIHVFLTQRWIERDPYQQATKIFNFHQLGGPHQNGVLIYINLRYKKFAILSEPAIHQTLSSYDWEKFGLLLQENLRSTQYEKAISMSILSLGEILKEKNSATL